MPYIRNKRTKELVKCKVHARDLHRPIRKKGKRLGSWTSKKFYQDMTLVSWTGSTGNHHMQWVKTRRIVDDDL